MTNLIGKMLLNRYRVDEFIGRGGMAEVYKAWDSQRSNYLAMKVLSEDLAIDRVFVRRFQREAQTLARLQHPNIVRFYGLEQAGPYAFMLLDYIEGKSLKRLIFDQGGPIPLAHLETIFHSICTALQYAHVEGMVHCDMKPGNVMVNRRGDVLVMDFGIARMADAATATMVGMGTPAYMAPEQARGLDPVPQTDIYALGIILYELITGGERPFTGESAQTTGSTSERVRWEQIYQEPPSPRSWNPTITTELETIVLRCLEKDPKDRYQTPLDLLNDLKLALSTLVDDLEQEAIIPVMHDDGDIQTIPPKSEGSLKQRILSKWIWIAGASVLIFLVAMIFKRPRQIVVVETVVVGVESTSVDDQVSETEFAPLPSATQIPPSETPLPGNTLAPTSTTLPTNTLRPSKTSTPAPTQTAQFEAANCPGSLPNKLKVGDQARVDIFQLAARSVPGFTATKEHVLARDRIVEIVAGPECADRATWWTIYFSGTVSSGEYLEYQAWMPEVDNDTYYLVQAP